MTEAQPTPNALEQALALAAQGFRVFPIIKDGKLPAVFAWPVRASYDPEKIRVMFSSHDPVNEITYIREYNVGIATGRMREGYCCIADVDVKTNKHGVKAQGRESLANLDMLAPAPWLDTKRVETVSGGEHLYFRTDKPLRSTASTVAPGIDTRGEGGYVVAEGSIVGDGSYAARGGVMRDMPEWLVDMIGEHSITQKDSNVTTWLDTEPAMNHARDYLLAEAPLAVEGSGGDAMTLQVAMQVRDRGVSEQGCVELMFAHWNDRCTPPWEYETLACKVSNAYQYATKEIGNRDASVAFDEWNEETDPPLVHVPKTAAKPAPKQIKASPFNFRDPRSIAPRQNLYGGHYTRRYVSGTAAPSGLGKTANSFGEALSMVTRRPLLGATVAARPLRVWVWNGEDPLEELERRLAAIMIRYDISAEDIGGRLYVNSGRDTPIVIATKDRDSTVVAAPVIDQIKREIRDNGIDVLIIDPFISSHSVPENDNGAIDTAVKTWAKIAEEEGVAVELIHHTRKPANGAQGDFSIDDARGAGSLIGAVRSMRVLNPMNHAEAERAGISADDRRLYFKLSTGKANMRPPSDAAEWRKLVSVALNNGTNEDPGDWVGVVTEWKMPDALEDITPADVAKVQDRIGAGTWSENAQAKDWAGLAVAEALGLDPTDNAAKSKIRTLLKSWIEGGALRAERIHNKRQGRDKTVILAGVAP